MEPLTFRIVTPAPPLATLDLIQEEKPLSWWRRKAALIQLAGSATSAFIDASGRVDAVLGFYPSARRELVIFWFGIRPGRLRLLVPLAHHAHLTFRQLGKTGVQNIRAEIEAGHEPGQRMARIVGLEHVATGADGLEHWEWQNGLCRKGGEEPVRRRGSGRRSEAGGRTAGGLSSSRAR